MTDLKNYSAPSSDNCYDAAMAELSEEELRFLEKRLKAMRSALETTNRLAYYRPYKKQIEFHNSGAAPITARLFMAGNQLGKTLAGAAEMAMHLTGRYPEWFCGHRFHRPITALAGSESTELTRDGVQRLLVGPPAIEDDWGSGFIPKECIISYNRKNGVPNALDSITVKHKDGGTSQLFFKSYDQGRGKWQANTVDLGWLDEEPPDDVYSEARTRTNATRGIVYITFTPLLGMSNVVKTFLNEQSEFRRVVTMTIHDADHLTDADRERIISETPEHERDARTLGVPMLGSGAIFPIADSLITVAPFPIPRWWRRIGGMDFGYDHPFGAVDIAYDPDMDVIYVTREYRISRKTPADHATALRGWGLRWAWPHDGAAHEKGLGKPLSKQYREHGLQMLPEHATFTDGTVSVEAGVFDMYDRMTSGRWKVFSTCTGWFEEKRMYHREDGKIVKLDDDLLSASRYATMMLRHARAAEAGAYRGAGSQTASAVADGAGTVAGF